MLLANKEADMTVLKSFNFVEYAPLANNNPAMVRRRKLLAKVEEQLALAKDSSFVPTKHKWVTDDDGTQRKIVTPKRIKPWWALSADGKVNLVVRYGSKALEFARGKNAIELASEAEVAPALVKIKEAVELGEFDAIIAQHLELARSGAKDKKK
jgi:hypothetical protein